MGELSRLEADTNAQLRRQYGNVANALYSTLCQTRPFGQTSEGFSSTAGEHQPLLYPFHVRAVDYEVRLQIFKACVWNSFR